MVIPPNVWYYCITFVSNFNRILIEQFSKNTVFKICKDHYTTVWIKCVIVENWGLLFNHGNVNNQQSLILSRLKLMAFFGNVYKYFGNIL